MRLWILFGCGVLVLAGALWPFGKRTEQLGTVPAAPTVATQTPAEAPKAKPAPLPEVIDLARAYEPVREIEEPAGQVNPASFIAPPKYIPRAMDHDDPYRDVLKKVQEAQTGTFIMGVNFSLDVSPREAIDVTPREVAAIRERMSDFVPSSATAGELVFTPMGVPYAVGITQPIPPNASIQNGLLNFTPTGVETKLTIMPRVVKQSD
jgi:hypothetical protein